MNIKEELYEQRFLKVGHGQPPQKIMGYSEEEKMCAVELYSGTVVKVIVKKYEGIRWNARHLRTHIEEKRHYQGIKNKMI